MDQLKFAEKIKEARSEKGWTQKELAARLQVTDKAVSKWERALSFPDIELLGPISRELDIPLAELLDMEEITPASGNPEEWNSLLEKLLARMKEKVHQELKRRKKKLCIAIGIFVGLSILLVAIDLGRSWYRNQEYHQSERIISYDEITVNSIEEQEDTLYINISIPPEAPADEVLTRYWRDKTDSTVMYIQFAYYEKPWLLYDSMDDYLEYVNQPGVSLSSDRKTVDVPMPVTKVIYQNGEDVVLWEK